MRLRAKTDANHAAIVKQLRQIGCMVLDLSRVGKGCPDIAVGHNGRNYLFEIKDGNLPPSRKALSLDERIFHRGWTGQVHVIENLDQALKIMQAGK